MLCALVLLFVFKAQWFRELAVTSLFRSWGRVPENLFYSHGRAPQRIQISCGVVVHTFNLSTAERGSSL